jgi:hypothetical protein
MEKVRIADLEINYQDVLKSLVDLKKGIDDTKESTKELTVQQKALAENGQQSTDQYAKNAKAIETNNIVLKGLTSEYQNNQKVLTTNIASQKEGQGTLERLESRNKELRIALKGLNLETEAGKQKQKEYIAEINKNSEAIKTNVDAATQQKLNIGNYKSALDTLPPSLQGGVRGFQALTGAAKVFLANPIVLAITAIVGIIVGLVKAFKNTQEGGEKISIMFDKMRAVIDVIKDRIENFALILGKIFSGEAKLRDLKGAFAGMGDEMKREVEIAGKLKEALIALEKKEVDMIVTSADRTAKIAKLMEASADLNKTDRERIALLAEAKRLTDEEAAAQQKLVLGQIANKLGNLDEAKVIERINQLRRDGKQLTLDEIGLAHSTETDRKEANELIAKYIGLEEEASRKNKEVSSKLSGLYKKQLADQEELNKMAEEKNTQHLKVLVDQEVAHLDEILNIQKPKLDGIKEQRLNSELETQQLIYDTRIAQNENLFTAERQLMEANMKEDLSLVRKGSAEEYLIKQKYAAYAKNLAREEQSSKLAIYGDFAGSLASLFGENTKVARIAAVAQATINTYLGATAAFTYTTGGIITRSLAAGAAIATGLASVKKILSVKSGLPGDSGGSSTSVPSASASAESVPGVQQTATSAFDPTNPAYNMVQQIYNNQPVLVLEDFQNVQNNAIQVRQSAEL